MPKPKSSVKKKKTAKPPIKKKTAPAQVKKAKPKRPPAKKKRVPAQAKPKRPPVKKQAKAKQYSAEYAEYLERYELYGEGRPRLSTAEFDRLDDELLDVLALEAERGLDDEQIIRLQELEFLLLDSEQ